MKFGKLSLVILSYLLANSCQAAVFVTSFEPSEGSGGANKYYHLGKDQADAIRNREQEANDRLKGTVQTEFMSDVDRSIRVPARMIRKDLGGCLRGGWYGRLGFWEMLSKGRSNHFIVCGFPTREQAIAQLIEQSRKGGYDLGTEMDGTWITTALDEEKEVRYERVEGGVKIFPIEEKVLYCKISKQDGGVSYQGKILAPGLSIVSLKVCQDDKARERK